MLLAVVCCKTIRIAIAVLKQSMIAIGKVPVIFIMPVFTIIFVAVHAAWSIPAAYMFYTTGMYDSINNMFNFQTNTWDSNF